MVRINNSRQELSRERVYNFYIENKSLGKRYTINHFTAENFSERTIYSIIERAENQIGPKRVFGSGRIVKKMTKKNVAKLKTIRMEFYKGKQRENLNVTCH